MSICATVSSRSRQIRNNRLVPTTKDSRHRRARVVYVLCWTRRHKVCPSNPLGHNITSGCRSSSAICRGSGLACTWIWGRLTGDHQQDPDISEDRQLITDWAECDASIAQWSSFTCTRSCWSGQWFVYVRNGSVARCSWLQPGFPGVQRTAAIAGAIGRLVPALFIGSDFSRWAGWRPA